LSLIWQQTCHDFESGGRRHRRRSIGRNCGWHPTHPSPEAHQSACIPQGPVPVARLHTNILLRQLLSTQCPTQRRCLCHSQKQWGHLWRSSLRCQCIGCSCPRPWVRWSSSSKRLYRCFATVAAADPGCPHPVTTVTTVAVATAVAATAVAATAVAA
jgi:hypothetical protein